MADFEQVNNPNNPSSPTMSESQAGLARVTFRDIPETYPLETAVTCKFTIHPTLNPRSDDHIALFKVGWTSVKDFVYSVPMPIVENCTPAAAIESSLIFNASDLPGEDGEFYQFCYVCGTSGHICGASLPFQFGTDDFEIIDDHDDSIDDVDFPVRSTNDSLIVVDGVGSDQFQSESRVVTTVTISSPILVAKSSTNSLANGKYSAELEATNARLQLELESARAELQLRDISHQAETARMRTEFTEKLSEKLQECSELEREVATLKGRLSDLDPKSNELEGSLFALQVAQSTLAERNSKLTRENDDLTKQNKDLKRQLDDSLKREIDLKAGLGRKWEEPDGSGQTTTRIMSAHSFVEDVENSWAVPDSLTSQKSELEAEPVTLEAELFQTTDSRTEDTQRPIQTLYPYKTWFHNPYADYIPAWYQAGINAGSKLSSGSNLLIDS